MQKEDDGPESSDGKEILKSKSVPMPEEKEDDPKAKLKETDLKTELKEVDPKTELKEVDPKTELKEADVKPESKIEQKETLVTPKGTKELKIEL